MNKKVVYDDSESVWKFGQFISKFPDDMLSHSLVFEPLGSKNIKGECEIETLKKKHREGTMQQPRRLARRESMGIKL